MKMAPASPALNSSPTPSSFTTPSSNGPEPVLKFCLELLLHLLHFGVGILLKAIDLDREPIDFLLRLPTRVGAEHRAALLDLLLVGLQRLGFIGELRRFFLRERLHFPLLATLPSLDSAANPLQIDKRHP